MVRKTDENKNIGENTQILFNIKQFVSLIIALLAFLIGFYNMVIVPRVQSVETQYEKIIDIQQKNHDHISSELEAINKSIFAIKLNVQEIQLTKGIKPISMEENTKLYNKDLSMHGDTTKNTVTNLDEFYPSAYVKSKNN